MTDLEMTRLCAGAMGFIVDEEISKTIKYGPIWVLRTDAPDGTYDPLHDDAQAMALVKKFRLSIHTDSFQSWWVNYESNMPAPHDATHDLNRAIVECVAKMQAAKK